MRAAKSTERFMFRAIPENQREDTRLCDSVIVASDGSLPLTTKMIEQFHTRGYIIVRNLVTEDDCANVQRACERLVQAEITKLMSTDPPSIANDYIKSTFSRRLFDIYCEAGMDKAPLLFRKVNRIAYALERTMYSYSSPVSCQICFIRSCTRMDSKRFSVMNDSSVRFDNFSMRLSASSILSTHDDTCAPLPNQRCKNFAFSRITLAGQNFPRTRVRYDTLLQTRSTHICTIMPVSLSSKRLPSICTNNVSSPKFRPHLGRLLAPRRRPPARWRAK